MSKKFVTLFTLVAFIIFSLSCTVYKTERVSTATVVSWEEKEFKILGVVKISGEYIVFNEERPGRILENSIVGTVGTVSISIPLSEIKLVWVKRKRVHGGRTAFAVIGGTLVVGLGALLIILATKESCPFIYSYDGEKFVFDAEPYGGAICQGLKRTEWCGLEHLKEVNGQYRIMVTNEVNETQYTDELKLVVVDHPKGVKVTPDISGRIRTVSQPVIPILAYDNKGKDLMPFISKNDRVFWVSRDEEKNPKKKEDLRDELIFGFPKPKGAKKAKLIVNACNTLWGSQSLKQYLDLYGNKVGEWYEEVKNRGPAFFKMKNLHFREELYSLQVRVNTEEGWKSKGIIIGGGPFISEDKIYSLDISDVPGDTLKIKLAPPAAFWMINYLAIDYSEDLLVQIKEIEAREAIDHKGQDVREILAKNDNKYMIMPDKEDFADLIFESPPKSDGMNRTVILKASGYYDIHLEGKGEPRLQIIDKLHSEPGFVVQYAFKEYLKWKKEIMAKIVQK